ncbi:hypothetical protein DCS_07158 [Drechmeria coniospora]|uniref:Uncharacterized protein n=1 Tax=Drechmeria coniospora TaxID=98403 RepID=A0A151GDN2_DRECN|nr:hypothetical protein DCS_07158 [Drechmeria coniospora]KYK55196.1 hypothetical protein DCS_07158 [Drechmeria coniospora]
MEQIETQASDLRYLAQVPVALSDSASVSYGTPQPRPAQGSPDGSATFGDNSALASHSNKRKSIDDGPGSGQKQTRSKRNRVSFTLFLVPIRRRCCHPTTGRPWGHPANFRPHQPLACSVAVI